jgi:hypothetical protein
MVVSITTSWGLGIELRTPWIFLYSYSNGSVKAGGADVV